MRGTECQHSRPEPTRTLDPQTYCVHTSAMSVRPDAVMRNKLVSSCNSGKMMKPWVSRTFCIFNLHEYLWMLQYFIKNIHLFNKMMKYEQCCMTASPGGGRNLFLHSIWNMLSSIMKGRNPVRLFYAVNRIYRRNILWIYWIIHSNIFITVVFSLSNVLHAVSPRGRQSSTITHLTDFAAVFGEAELIT